MHKCSNCGIELIKIKGQYTYQCSRCGLKYGAAVATLDMECSENVVTSDTPNTIYNTVYAQSRLKRELPGETMEAIKAIKKFGDFA